MLLVRIVLQETSAHYAEDAAAAEAVRVQLALQEEECGRLSKELAEAHDNLAALHLEAQVAAQKAPASTPCFHSFV